MNKLKLIATSVFLMGSLAVVTPAIAAEANPDCKAGHQMKKGAKQGAFDRRTMRALNLTEEQKASIKAQREANKPEREALHNKMKDAHKALMSAVDAGANNAELSALAQALGGLKGQQALARAKDHQAFVALLTAEQKQTLSELKAKRIERREARKSKSE